MTDPDRFHPSGLAGAVEFIQLEETLRDFTQGETFIFVLNPGNWGDGLIRYATERFFRQNSFRYVRIRLAKAVGLNADELRAITGSSKVRVVYSGGGAFLKDYRIPQKVQRLIGDTDRVLVLPHTFAIHADELGLRKTDILFRRDESGSKEFAPNSIFCHDMALSLGRVVPSFEGTGTGYFFRRDKEKVEGMKEPEGNRDLSAEGTEQSHMAGFFEALARFETIHTNRLHAAIAAAMMGRRVHLYANSYFKNQSIYEASLRVAFPNVSFHQQFPTPAAVDQKMSLT